MNQQQDLKGTSVLTLILKGELVASAADGRAAVEEPITATRSFCHIVRGEESKLVDICGEYLASLAGSGHYANMIVDDIKEKYDKNTEGLTMEEIVKSVKVSYFEKWENEVDKNRYCNDGKFPASVCVFGLDGAVHTIAKEGANIALAYGLKVEGKEAIVVYQGYGAKVAKEHLERIEARLTSDPREMVMFLMESLAASAIELPSSGGFLLGATITEKGTGQSAVRFYKTRPHFSRVVQKRFKYLDEYLRSSFLVVTLDDYYQDHMVESQLEEDLKKKFGDDLFNITLVGVRKVSDRKNPLTARLLNFSYPEGRSAAEPILEGMKMNFRVPTRDSFKKLAKKFKRSDNCL